MRTEVIDYAEFQTGRQSALAWWGHESAWFCTKADGEAPDETQAQGHFRQSSRGSRFGATLKATLDHDLGFVGQPSGREVEAREVAVEMLELFMTSHHDFRQWHNWGRGASSSRARTGSTRGARWMGMELS